MAWSDLGFSRATLTGNWGVKAKAGRPGRKLWPEHRQEEAAVWGAQQSAQDTERASGTAGRVTVTPRFSA